MEGRCREVGRSGGCSRRDEDTDFRKKKAGSYLCTRDRQLIKGHLSKCRLQQGDYSIEASKVLRHIAMLTEPTLYGCHDDRTTGCGLNRMIEVVGDG